MDAAAPRPSSPSLFAWLATGFTVATLVLDRLLPRTVATGPDRVGTLCLLVSAPLILLPFRDLRLYGLLGRLRRAGAERRPGRDR